jgi:hypothetical protein
VLWRRVACQRLLEGDTGDNRMIQILPGATE